MFYLFISKKAKTWCVRVLNNTSVSQKLVPFFGGGYATRMS
jgi:hypothetical protein